MKSLLNFLLRFKTLILFLILEGLALFMISSSSDYHQSVVLNTARSISGRLKEAVETGRSYFMLRRVNEQLVAENTALRRQVESLSAENQSTITGVTDSVAQLTYTYLDARVINNSVNKQKNFITLDRGRKHGVAESMAVASADGIVGVIVGVSQNYSVAMSLLNVDFRLSARIRNNDYFGSLAWDGRNYRYAQLSEIPHHVVVAQGDTIVTSGYSAIFPPGFIIGILTGEQKRGGDFITLRVELAADFKQLTNVYIIGNLRKHEIETLEEEVTDE